MTLKDIVKSAIPLTLYSKAQTVVHYTLDLLFTASVCDFKPFSRDKKSWL